MRKDASGRVGGWTTENAALEVLKTWCELRTGRTPSPSDVAEERMRLCLCSVGPRSLKVGRWRSQVPSVNSPECVEGLFSELRLDGVLGSSSPRKLRKSLICVMRLVP